MLRFAVVLDRVRGRADAVGPPVGQVAAVHGAVLQFGGDGRVQLLQADHADVHAVRVPGGVAFDRAQDLRLGRGVVAEHAGHAGKDKVIRVAVLFALVQVMVQIAAQRFDRVGGQVCAKVLHHEVGRAVGAQPQHVAKVIVLAVPHQQPLPGGVLPPVGGLVAVERVHAVVAVDVRVQKLDAMAQQHIALAHRDAVDVGAHGRFRLHAPAAQQRAGFAQAAVQHRAVRQVAEVEIVGRKAEAAGAHQRKELFGLGGGGFLQELLGAEPGLAVPAEGGVARLAQNAQRAADVIDLDLHDALLQVGIADVGVGMMDDVQGLDLAGHSRYLPIFPTKISGRAQGRGGPFCLYHSRRRRAWQAARAKKKKQNKSVGNFLKNAPFPCCRRAPKALQ